MGYAGKLDLKEKAINFRKKGFSYNAIQQKISVSKDTLSRWLRDIELTEAHQQKLMSNKKNGQKKGSLVAAENKRKLRIQKLNTIRNEARKELGTISSHDNFIFGLALYAGEGDKTDGKGAFTNSDPHFIEFMVNWLKEYCNLNEDQLKGALWIHEENDETEAKKYWAGLTRIPLQNFHKSYIVQRKEKVAFRKNIHPHGVFSIRFYNSDLQRKILGWISVFLGDKIANTQLNETFRDSSMAEQEAVKRCSP